MSNGFRLIAACLLLSGCAAYPPGYAVRYPTIAAVVPDNLTRLTQIELIRLGYLHDVADGVFGPRTHNAIYTFERANRLPADGSPSWSLLATLRVSNAVAMAVVAPTPVAVPVAPAAAWVAPAPSTEPMPANAAPATTSAGWVSVPKTP